MPALIDAQKAVTRALADFIGGQRGPLGDASAFPGLLIDTGKSSGPYPFTKALEDWPTGDEPVTYPECSVVPVEEAVMAHDLGMTYLYTDRKCPVRLNPKNPAMSYILQKRGEYTFALQIDVWADTVPMHDAIKRALEDNLHGSNVDGGQLVNGKWQTGQFVPNTTSSYFGLKLDVGSDYFNRTARISLRHNRPNISEDQAFRDERRRTMFADASIEWVREVQVPTRIKPQINTTQVGEAVQIAVSS